MTTLRISKGTIPVWIIAFFAQCFFIHGTLPAAPPEQAAVSPCEEPEAKLLDRPAVRLEHWPAGFEDGLYVLGPASPAENALCTWQAAQARTQSRILLNLALNAFGKPEFHLRFQESNGRLRAKGIRPAKAGLYGFWQVRGLEERGTGPDGRMVEEGSSTFQPGSALLAARPGLVDAAAEKNILLDLPEKIAGDIKAGRGDPWLEVFNLDEMSRRYLLRVCAGALRSPAAPVRESAVQCLGAMGALGAEAAPLLTQALRDPDEDVSGYAAESLQKLGELKKLSVTQLAAELSHKSTMVRWEVAKALADLGPGARAAVPALVKATADRDMYVRQDAIRALRAAGAADDQAVAALTGALSDRYPSVRVEAAKALFKFNRASDKASEAMDGLLRSNDVNDRAWAAEALGLMGSAGVPRLALILSDPSLHVREYAYKALAAIKTQDAAKATEEYDATEMSPRFWEKLVKLAGETGPGRAGIEPMLVQLRKGFLRWRPASCAASARDKFVLYKTPDLRDPVIDLSAAGKSYRVSDYDVGYNPLVDVTFLDHQDSAVRLRTDQGKEGWARRDSFSCSGRLVTGIDGRVKARLYPLPKILERERDVRFAAINGKPHLAFARGDASGQYHPGLAFELDPETLAIIDVKSYDDRAAGPPKIGQWPKGFPLELFGGHCIGCFEIGGKVFLN